MNGPRLAAVLRSGASPATADRMWLSLARSSSADIRRHFSKTSSTNGFFKKLWSGEDATQKEEITQKAEDKSGESLVESNISSNSSAAHAIKPQPEPQPVSTPRSSSSSTSRRPAVSTATNDIASRPGPRAASAGTPAGAVSTPMHRAAGSLSGVKQQLQQPLQRKLAAPIRQPPSQQLQRFERPERSNPAPLNRQPAKAPRGSSSSSSSLRPPALSRNTAPLAASAPITPRTAVAPLRVAVQRARIDARKSASPRAAPSATNSVANSDANSAAISAATAVNAEETAIDAAADRDVNSAAAATAVKAEDASSTVESAVETVKEFASGTEAGEDISEPENFAESEMRCVEVEQIDEASLMEGREYDLQGFQGEWASSQESTLTSGANIEVSKETMDIACSKAIEDAHLVEEEGKVENELEMAGGDRLTSKEEKMVEGQEIYAVEKNLPEEGIDAVEGNWEKGEAIAAVEEKTGQGDEVPLAKPILFERIKSFFKSR